MGKYDCCKDMRIAYRGELFPMDHMDCSEEPLGDLRFCPWCGSALDRARVDRHTVVCRTNRPSSEPFGPNLTLPG